MERRWKDYLIKLVLIIVWGLVVAYWALPSLSDWTIRDEIATAAKGHPTKAPELINSDTKSKFDKLLNKIGLMTSEKSNKDKSYLAKLAKLTGIVITAILIIIMASRTYFRQKRKKAVKGIEILLSRDDTAEPFEVTGFFDSVYGNLLTPYFSIFKGFDSLAWEIVKEPDGAIRFFLFAPEWTLERICSRLQSVYQNIRFNNVQVIENDINFQHIRQFQLEREWFYTIKTLKNYQLSVMESLVSVLEAAQGKVKLQFVLTPKGKNIQNQVKEIQQNLEVDARMEGLNDPSGADPGVGYTEAKEIKGSLELTGKGIFDVEIRLATDDKSVIQSVAGALGEAGADNRIIQPDIFNYLLLTTFKSLWLKWFSERLPSILLFKVCILSSVHLATILHLPTTRVRIQGLNRVLVRRGVAPLGVPRDPNRAILQDEEGPVSVSEDSRYLNILLLGSQGTGKSTTMENIFLSDLHNPGTRGMKAIIVIDPNQDLAEKLIGFCPPDDNTIYLNITDPNLQIGINPFLNITNKDVAVDNIISIFKQYFGREAIGPKSEEYLANALYALLDVGKDIQFQHIYDMLSDPGFRQEVIDRIQDPFQQQYWKVTFANAEENNPKYVAESLSPILNKLNRILSVQLVRKTLSLPGVDLREIIRGRKRLIINLAKGLIGEENAALLGNFLIAQYWQIIQEQASLPKDQRIEVSLIIDEAHNFVIPALEKILAEGRKVGGQNTIAFQFRKQIQNPKILEAITSLVQNIILFRTQQLEDAEYYAKIFMRLYSNMISVDDKMQDRLNFGPDDIMSLPTYHAITRLVVNNSVIPPFVAQTIVTDKFYRKEWADYHRRGGKISA